MTEPKVSVVIGSYNRHAFLRLTIESVREDLDGLASEIIVVDGGSDDGSLPWLAAQRDVIAIIHHNRGAWRGKTIERRSWGYFMNLGFKAAQGKYVCMLSDDCLLVPGAIRNGIEVGDRSLRNGGKLGAVAFFWRNWPEQADYWVGLTLLGKMFLNHGLYLREALAAIGYADEESFVFYHADGDLCLRLWESGFECIASPDSFVEHYSHAAEDVRTSNLATQKRDWERYLEKWSAIWRTSEVTKGQGWVHRSFQDLTETAARFRTIPDVRRRLIASAIKSAIGRAKSSIWRR